MFGNICQNCQKDVILGQKMTSYVKNGTWLGQILVTKMYENGKQLILKE